MERLRGDAAGLGDAQTLLGEDLPNFFSDFGFLFLKHNTLKEVRILNVQRRNGRFGISSVVTVEKRIQIKM